VRTRRARSRCFAWIAVLAAGLPLAPHGGSAAGIESVLAASVEESARDTAQPHPSASATPVHEHGLARHLAEVRPLLERYGYAAVFAAIFVEGFGIPAPGQTLLIAAALLAAGGGLGVVPLLVVALLGSAGGTFVGWWLGRTGGRRLLDRFPGPRLERLQETCRRRGGLFVAFGRFVDGARQLSGPVAGALGMPLATFLAWNAIGAVAWVATWGVGSFVLERNVHVLVHAYHRVGPIAAAAILVAIGGVILWVVRGRSAS